MKTPKKTIVDVQLNDPQTQKKIHRRVSYVSHGCKYYFNAQYQFLQLNRSERAFFDYLVERMDHGNRITIDNELRTAFGDFICRVTSKKKEYQPGSASKHISKLVSTGLLLQTTRNTLYIINPKYVFNGTETIRKQVIKNLVEHRVEQKLPIDSLINVPIDTFMAAQ
jgi:hypothetical protein